MVEYLVLQVGDLLFPLPQVFGVFKRVRQPNATYFGTIGGHFVNGARRAARFSGVITDGLRRAATT